MSPDDVRVQAYVLLSLAEQSYDAAIRSLEDRVAALESARQEAVRAKATLETAEQQLARSLLLYARAIGRTP